jgi:hypothetical protein
MERPITTADQSRAALAKSAERMAAASAHTAAVRAAAVEGRPRKPLVLHSPVRGSSIDRVNDDLTAKLGPSSPDRFGGDTIAGKVFSGALPSSFVQLGAPLSARKSLIEEMEDVLIPPPGSDIPHPPKFPASYVPGGKSGGPVPMADYPWHLEFFLLSLPAKLGFTNPPLVLQSASRLDILPAFVMNNRDYLEWCYNGGSPQVDTLEPLLNQWFSHLGFSLIPVDERKVVPPSPPRGWRTNGVPRAIDAVRAFYPPAKKAVLFLPV